MKKVKKSTWVTVALLIYVSATAAYLLPRNHEVSDTEKYLTLAASYVIVLVLWLVLRKKEQMQQRRREDEHMNNLKKQKRYEEINVDRMSACRFSYGTGTV